MKSNVNSKANSGYGKSSKGLSSTESSYKTKASELDRITDAYLEMVRKNIKAEAEFYSAMGLDNSQMLDKFYNGGFGGFGQMQQSPLYGMGANGMPMQMPSYLNPGLGAMYPGNPLSQNVGMPKGNLSITVYLGDMPSSEYKKLEEILNKLSTGKYDPSKKNSQSIADTYFQNNSGKGYKGLPQ